MKKTISILIAVLIGVCAMLAVLGSSAEYAAEKLFYKAMKINKKIAMNPDVAPPALLASVENNLTKLLKKYPKTDMAKTARIALAEFYISNKIYDKALSTANAVLNAYDKDVTVASTAQFLKGVIYEKQNQWDKALREYTILRDKYPNTQLGIQVPLYVGRYYTGKGMDAEANAAFNEAGAFYERIERENKGNMLGYIASTLLMQAYLNLKRYDEAGRVVEETIKNYPSPTTLVQLLPYVDLIFVKTLKKPEKAIGIYKDVKERTRDAKLAKFLEKRIEKLETKK